MIQSRGFESSWCHASGLFHTFPKKSHMTERLLNGRRAKIIYLCSFYNCGDGYNIHSHATLTANLDSCYSRRLYELVP